MFLGVYEFCRKESLKKKMSPKNITLFNDKKNIVMVQNIKFVKRPVSVLKILRNVEKTFFYQNVQNSCFK